MSSEGRIFQIHLNLEAGHFSMKLNFPDFFLLLLSTSLVDKVLSSVNIFNSNEDCYYSG